MDIDNSDLETNQNDHVEELNAFEKENSEFLQEMEQLLDEHDYALPSVGDIRTGVIVSISGQGVIVDLGLKRDGIIPTADLEKLPQKERESLKINDEIDVYVQSTDQTDSLIVSRHMALLNQDWIHAQDLMDSGEIFEGEIIGYNRGGALVGFGGLRGFVPSSHLSELSPNMNDKQRQQSLAKMRGEIVPLKVVEVDRRRRRLVLSEREASKVWKEKKHQELMESLATGDVLTGRVSGWKDFGAFVDLGGVDGLIHVSELAWYRVNHPRQVLKMGEEIEVYVLKVDRENDRISLSRKKLLPNPWSLVTQKYSENQLVEGRIIRIVDYGAFVELEPGIEGLLHVSQLSRGQVAHPREVVKQGETHLLRIISIDQERERIGLSLKAVRAFEQIEWMTQKELDAEAAAKEAAAKEAVAKEETAEEVAAEENVVEEAATEEVAVEEVTAEEEVVEDVAAEEVAVEDVVAEEEVVEDAVAEEKVVEDAAEDEVIVEEVGVEDLDSEEMTIHVADVQEEVAESPSLQSDETEEPETISEEIIDLALEDAEIEDSPAENGELDETAAEALFDNHNQAEPPATDKESVESENEA